MIELWTIVSRLQIDCGFLQIDIECDSMTTLSLISNGCSLQRQIKDLLGNFPSILFNCVHREPNQVVDSLPEFSLSLPLAVECLM